MRLFLIEHLSPYADDVRIDAMGNVFFTRKGSGSSPRTIMLAAHMDEISFLVRHITKEGFIYVQPLGGFDARVLDAQRVWIHGRERIPEFSVPNQPTLLPLKNAQKPSPWKTCSLMSVYLPKRSMSLSVLATRLPSSES